MPKKVKVKKSEKPIIPKAEVKAEETALPGEALAYAKSRLATFLEMRKNAADMEIYKNASFWIKHFQKVISDLENK